MTETILIYLLKANIALALLYAIYKLLLSNETFFSLNRVIILAIPATAFLVPAVADILQVYENELLFTIKLDELIVGQSYSPASPNSFSWFYFVGFIFIGGAIIRLGLIVKSFFSLIALTKKYSSQINDGYRVYKGPFPASSFWNYIFIPDNLKADEERLIIEHELVHIRQKHSVDIIYMHLIEAVCWFNPFAYKLSKELRAVHEFMADEAVNDKKNITKYAKELLQQAFQTNESFSGLTHNFFNQSILKRRITMITKSKSKKMALLKYLGIMPAIAFMALSFSSSSISAQENVKEGDVTGKNAKGEDIFAVVDNMPEFKGEQDALFSYLAKTITYPAKAKQEGLEGKTFITFVVNKSGNITDAKILRGFNSECDEVALNAIKSMPAWKPGKHKGKPVNVQIVVPIQFALAEKK